MIETRTSIIPIGVEYSIEESSNILYNIYIYNVITHHIYILLNSLECHSYLTICYMYGII